MVRSRLVVSSVLSVSTVFVIGNVSPSNAQSFSFGDLFPSSSFGSTGVNQNATSGGWLPSGANQHATSGGWLPSGYDQNATSVGWPTGSQGGTLSNLGSLLNPLGGGSSGGSSGGLGDLSVFGNIGNIGSVLGGSTSVGNLGNLGSLLGGLGGGSGSGSSGGGASSNPIVSLLQQFQGIQSQLGNVLQTVLGDITSQLGQAIQGAMGSLNIPDPSALLDAVLKNSGLDNQNGQNGAAKENVSGISAVVLNNNQSKEIQAKTFNATYLSKDAQDNIQKELQTVLQMVQGSGQLVQSSAQLGQQSAQAVTQSGKSAQTASTTAEGAQKRVSTQDAIKDLNTIASVQSGQLGTLSGQLGAQSGQLSNITGLQASQLQVQGNTAARTTQIAITSAVTAQQVMETNSYMRGQEQLRVMQSVATSDRLNQLSQQGLSLIK